LLEISELLEFLFVLRVLRGIHHGCGSQKGKNWPGWRPRQMRARGDWKNRSLPCNVGRTALRSTMDGGQSLSMDPAGDIRSVEG
jgi:hypothetical protein